MSSCKHEVRKDQDAIEGQEIELKYAEGFTITDFGTHKILEVKNPWPEANKSYRYQLLEKGKQNIVGQDYTFDGALTVPVEKNCYNINNTYSGIGIVRDGKYINRVSRDRNIFLRKP